MSAGKVSQANVEDSKFFKDFIRTAIKSPIEYLETYIDPKATAPRHRAPISTGSTSSTTSAAKKPKEPETISLKFQVLGSQKSASVKIDKTLKIEQLKSTALKELGVDTTAFKATFVYKGRSLGAADSNLAVGEIITDQNASIHVTLMKLSASSLLPEQFWADFEGLLKKHLSGSAPEAKAVLEGFKKHHSEWIQK